VKEKSLPFSLQAFDTPEKPYLPDEILWRQKEQFSDGVGYSWIDDLKVM
jgi:asparagine synthase (glutamine-hydrolysing)